MVKLSASSYKCPSCGYNLVYSTDEQLLSCTFCGSSYSPEKIDLLSQIVLPDQGDDDTEADDKQEIICDSCGAKIITDNNTSATFCAFCGSPSLVFGRLTRRFRPDYVIPFKLSREDAVEKIREFVRSRKYAPSRLLEKKIDRKLTGLYVPFWLMDAYCYMHSYNTGYKDGFSGKEKYSIVATMDIAFKNVPFDGAINMRDDLMESIEPFDCSELKPFTTSYLQGFYAQRYDQSVEKLSDRILCRLQRYGTEAAAATNKSYDYYRSDGCVTSPHDIEQKYALFPVWLYSYEYGGKRYSLAVNAQTGKVDGDLPVSRLRKILRYLGYYSVNFLIAAPLWLLVLAIVFWYNYNPTNAGAVIMICTLAVVISLPLIATKHAFKDMDERLGVEHFRYSLFNPIRRGLAGILRKRRAAKDKIRNETNMIMSEKPTFETYYDRSVKADIQIDEIFRGYESVFDDDRV